MPVVQCTCGNRLIYAEEDSTPLHCPRCGHTVSVAQAAGEDAPSQPSQAEAMQPIHGQDALAVSSPPVARPGEPRADDLVSRPTLTGPGLPQLLLGLVGILLPAWMLAGAAYGADVVGAMASPWLPLAMAMFLTVRAGGLDLSVWAVSSLGAVITWLAIAHGVPVWLAVGLAIVCGAAVGTVHASAVRVLRLPSILVTILGGLGASAGARLLVHTFSPARLSWDMLGVLSSMQGKELLAAGLFAVAMLGLLWGSTREAGPRGAGASFARRLGTALVASGALSAGGGAILLLGQSQVTPHLHLVGDLRVLVAVLLCGAWALWGRGTSLLAGILLPVALLAGTMWWQLVWDTGRADWGGMDISLLILLVLALGVQVLHSRIGRRSLAREVGSWLAWLGILVTAMGAYWRMTDVADYLRYAGGAIWLAGMILGLHGRASLRSRTQ